MKKRFFKKFIRKIDGATAVEYGLIVAILTVAFLAALDSIGFSLSSMYNTVSNTVDNQETGVIAD